MIVNFDLTVPRVLFLAILSLLVVPGCKKPYEKLKRPLPEKTFRQKQQLMHTIKKKRLFKSVKDMNLEEALEAKHYYQELGREDMVLRLIPHIIILSKDIKVITKLQLELAELELTSGNLEEAGKLYTEFIAAYPGDEQIKKARYHLLLTTFWTALEPDRDQVLTTTAVDLAKKYLQDFAEDTEYTPKVHEILKACYLALLEGELGLVKFYLNKFTYERKPSGIEAARNRLQHSKEVYLPVLALYDARAQELQQSLQTIEKVTQHEELSLVQEQAKQVAEQHALLEVLLIDPLQRQTAHPRDKF